jgi:adenylate cyclase class IV
LAVDAEEFEQARSRILSLADELGLADPERRSYLELVMLAADSPNGLS